MSIVQESIAANVSAVRERMAAACARAGRKPEDVRLVAITKSVGTAEILALHEAGVRDIGESRPQQLVQRAKELVEPDVAWHLVGHLQRNKVRRIWPVAACIHTVDSIRLARALGLEKHGQSGDRREPQCLIEINMAQETQKTGLVAADLEEVLAACRESGLAVRGLMTMAPLGAGEAVLRRTFAGLRELRDKALANGWAEALPRLSMGMSNDFEIAIEEGATMVRIGRALFTAGTEA